MLFSVLLTLITTIRFTIGDFLPEDSHNTNLFLDLDNDQLPSDGSALLDTGVGVGVGEEKAYGDFTFLTDSDSNSVALNDATNSNSMELAELGDLCEAPDAISPSKARMRTRTRDSSKICTPSDQDQTINQLEFPNLFDVLKPKKKAPTSEPLGPPPFGDSPTGEDGNPCPFERPVHLCCLQADMQGTNVVGDYIEYTSLSICSAGKHVAAE